MEFATHRGMKLLPIRRRPAPWWAAGLFGLLVGCQDAAPTPTPTPTPVDPIDRPARFLTDGLGRARIFHGFNVESASKGAAQGDPHQPRLTPTELSIARNDWGMTLARHLIFWGAVEPTMGTYDEAYLDAVEARLDDYAAAGVMVVLDMHQDLYSWTLSGNGFPDWAVMTVNQDPVAPTVPWSLAYFNPRVMEAFDNFWSNAGDYGILQERYAAAWAHVAERFRGHPAVLGYDVINEPHPGSLWDFGEGGTPAFGAGASYVFDQESLGPFYQRMVDAIRTVDADAWIFYEPRYGWPGDGAPSYLPALHDPRDGEAHLAQAPHLYSVAYEARGYYDPTVNDTIPRWQASREAEMRAHDTPLLCGEWGLDQGFPGADLFTEELLAMADRMMIGWTYWSWDSDGSWSAFDRTGDPAAPFTERPLMNRLVRPYPMAIAGKPVSFSYDPSTRIFQLVFDDVAGVTETTSTQIFLPDERVYPGGYYVRLSDPVVSATSTSFDDASNTLTVTVDPVHADRHVIVIGPTPP